MPLFIHLSVYGKMGKNLESARQEMISKRQFLHPQMLRLGLAYQSYQIIGSFDRCLALLNAFHDVMLVIISLNLLGHQ